MNFSFSCFPLSIENTHCVEDRETESLGASSMPETLFCSVRRGAVPKREIKYSN